MVKVGLRLNSAVASPMSMADAHQNVRYMLIMP